MRDFIRMGDVVCYAVGNEIEVGVVVRIKQGCSSYVIVPLNGKRSKERKASDLLTANRLLKIVENSKYTK